MMIRPMTAEDMDAVLIVENACFTDPWSRKSFEDSLNEPSAHLLVMAEEVKEEVAGYCCLYHALDEGEIVNVAVAPEYRQKGYGGELVRALMALEHPSERNAFPGSSGPGIQQGRAVWKSGL